MDTTNEIQSDNFAEICIIALQLYWKWVQTLLILTEPRYSNWLEEKVKAKDNNKNVSVKL